MKDCMNQMDAYNEVVNKELSEIMGEIIEYSIRKGFRGNIWKAFLAEEIALHENAYALACERRGSVEGNVSELVLSDIEVIYDLFNFDFKQFSNAYPKHQLDYLMDFRMDTDQVESSYTSRVMQFTMDLDRVGSAEEMKYVIDSFYKMYGVGEFALYHAFRLEEGEKQERLFEPIINLEIIKLDDLVGYEIPKRKLIDNTEAFLAGKPANNCLLFGDAGTGKSSSVKAILNAYADQGLRLIEVYKHQFHRLHEIISEISDRNYRFIIYMDDLSFENFETEYKHLKAIIEGGLGKIPDHILIYATSNRRHLIRENYSDKEEVRQDMHTSETVQEKLSLVARFGVSIFFCRPDRKEFQKIVTTLANRYKINISEEELLYKANQWELSHGGLSGRTAKQFIDYIRGGIEDEE
jgi:predicted AAA+ superfamily ATPase